jgi:hypothetical protein
MLSYSQVALEDDFNCGHYPFNVLHVLHKTKLVEKLVFILQVLTTKPEFLIPENSLN